MSHRIYTTPGFVVNSRPYGEGGKMLSIFTAELGQVFAIAEGIRLSKSKLRYHAQDYSFAVFSLVRGRDLWRVVGAETAHDGVAGTISVVRVRMFSMLNRLVQGEEKNAALFDMVRAAHEFLKKNETDLIETTALAEPIIMLRILHHLGYVRSSDELGPFLADSSFTPELFALFSRPGIKTKAIAEINSALQESHL
jgi:recombinational DNA repair protein (RecF pathway)